MHPGLAGAAGWSPLGAAAPSAAGLGMAYAGTAARADDASVVAANPAGMLLLEGVQWVLGAQVQNVDAEPKSGGISSTDVRNPVGMPYLYASKKMDERWAAGLALTSPYAFDARFDGSWSVGQAGRVSVKSQRLNPAIAYRYSDALSIGAGVSYQTLVLNSENAAGDYQGENSAWGWNLGAMYALSPDMRLGLAYRSSVRHSLQNGLDLDSPETVTFSVWQRYSDQWEAAGEFSRSRLSGLGGQFSTVQQAAFAYQDAWRFAWGAAYKHNEQWKSRFGFAVERNDADGLNRAAGLAEDHAVWLAMGVQYRLHEAGALDVGLALRWPSRAEFDRAGTSGEYALSGHVASVQYNHVY